MSSTEEKVSETETFEAGAVPVFLTCMVNVRFSLTRAEPGLTAMLIVTFGVIVPVAVGVGGVPVVVGVGVPGEPVTVGVVVAGVPVTVGVVVLTVVVRVAVFVIVGVIVGVNVTVGVNVSVRVIWSGMTSDSPWIELVLPGPEAWGFQRAGLMFGKGFRSGTAFEIDHVIRNSQSKTAVPTNRKTD